MLPYQTFYNNKAVVLFFTWQVLLVTIGSLLLEAKAQQCPPNLDFEKGTLESWSCYTGSAGEQNGTNNISLSPSFALSGRHTVFKRSATQEVDPYGEFPVVCPNGSGYSIRLGNNTAGTEAEGVSYEFTIPTNRNEYSLIYHYAVVFQDPSHLDFQQPRLEIEITNVTDNNVIACSSFTFYPVGSPLPGFFLSQNPMGNTPVWCKNWTAVSVNLDGMAGKTIRLFFKTADCTFRRHFGYAYVDVNSECAGEFTGATFCRGDSAVKVEAPYGYERYTWFDKNFSQVIGREQVISLAPAPPVGTTLAVEVIPYDGYGCPDTLYAKLVDTLTVRANAGDDKSICFGSPEQIGLPPKPGILYSWLPEQGLTDANIANPFADPEITTQYVLTSRSYGGGCVQKDTVHVATVALNKSMQLLGKDAYCLGNGDSAVLQLSGTGNIKWYKDDQVVAGANGIQYRVKESGTYYAQLSKDGCQVETAKKTILIEAPKKGVTYPTLYLVANEPVSLQARTFGTSTLWQPDLYLNTINSKTPVFTGAADQLYTIRIQTAAGCVAVDTQAIKIVKEADILVPSAFTPNHDGRNDVLRPALFGIRELRYFRVYNRWGQLLFQTTTPHQGWDGMYAGKMQANEVVVWVAEGIGVDGRRYLRKGTSVCLQ